MRMEVRSVVESMGYNFQRRKNGQDVESIVVRVPSFKLSDVLAKMISGVKKDKTNNRIIVVKMDVEGAEYPIIEEVVTSGIICEMTSHGVQFHLLLEYHWFAHNFSPTSPENAMDTYIYLIRRCGGIVSMEDGDTD